ncbi:hypothetical protein [Citrobacter tructae]|uniref:hypothetical protein n=1 Tax=Citrobacter tructae TaxID=2562449 RepID=UPI003F57E1F1
MRILFCFVIALWSTGSLANQCFQHYDEKDLVASVGVKPEKKTIEKEDGITKLQYEFIKNATREELQDEKVRDEYIPQFYITIYNPSCPKKIKLWFFGLDSGLSHSKVDLAGNAWSYLTGSEQSIFKNKLVKFNEVQKFESHDENANSIFMKAGSMYVVDVYLK